VSEHRGWRVVARHQLGALVTSAVDFAVMITAVHLGLTPVAGTAIGASCGAVTNFTLGRQWIFPADAPARMHSQAVRYAIVSATSLGLNTLGEFVMHDLLRVQYVVARLIVAVIVSLGWNYPLQRAWVFASRAREA
jgi:putative flippase GtrA